LRHRPREHTIVRIDRKPPLVYIGLFERSSDARELSRPCGEALEVLELRPPGTSVTERIEELSLSWGGSHPSRTISLSCEALPRPDSLSEGPLPSCSYASRSRSVGARTHVLQKEAHLAIGRCWIRDPATVNVRAATPLADRG
jgi:hypothetical protein